MIQSELAHLELLAEVDALVARLDRWANSAPAWEPAEKCCALVRRLSERATSLRVRIEAPLVVATLGGTGTGKSALVNALLGAEVVQTGRERPTTTRPTIVCRPDVTPEMLGIDPASVVLVQRDLPALREMVLVDCPDPDTTEEGAFKGCESLAGQHSESQEVGWAPPTEPLVAGSARPTGSLSLATNLARLRAILPKCDVLLVTATQQKYRSARVLEELTAAACGAQVVFVQTHADVEDDVRDDWRQALADQHKTDRIYFVDALRALDEAQAGLQPRGEFAALLDRVTRQLAGAAAARIRRANFLDLVAETLNACDQRISQATPAVEQLQTAIVEQRNLLGQQVAREMRAELLASRRQWEQRLLGQTASRWGFSPFSLVLRAYQGLGALVAGALLSRARTPAQMALWGTMAGVSTWRRYRDRQKAEHTVGQAAANCWDPAELRKAALIVAGYAEEADLSASLCGGDSPRLRVPQDVSRAIASPELGDSLRREAEVAAVSLVRRASADLDSVIRRLAQCHSGWLVRWLYELLLAAMLGLLLYRLGKNFFYDSWLAPQPSPMFGLEFYVSAGFWLVLWCLLLLWAFCSRLRRGLRGEIDRLAESWRAESSAAALFADLEAACRDCIRYRQELGAIQRHVSALQRQVMQSRG